MFGLPIYMSLPQTYEIHNVSPKDAYDSVRNVACDLNLDLYINWLTTLQWRYNGRDSVSNHQPHGCLLNRLFRRRSKKNIKAPRHWRLYLPHKWPVTRKMFPLDDVIMRPVIHRDRYMDLSGNLCVRSRECYLGPYLSSCLRTTGNNHRDNTWTSA